MSQIIENRRDFLKSALVASAALPFLVGCDASILAQRNEGELGLIKKNANTAPGVNWCGAIDAPDNVSWKTTIASKAGSDQDLVISGTVFEADGNTPAPNVLIYFYHTDSEGFYGRSKGEALHGHYRSWLLTDARGRYEFASIKPAPYPKRTDPAHIHMTLTSRIRREESVDSIWFEGDPFITAEKRSELTGRGSFDPIVKLQKGSDGRLYGVRNISLG